MSIYSNIPHPVMEASCMPTIRPILGESNDRSSLSDDRPSTLWVRSHQETEKMAWEFFVNELEFE
ncbi:MAG: hypothetical protein FJX89_07360 [Bacteroidetes bacterium]|nr:hypothetical protein [Bacteroidota bacterium]